MRAFCGWDIGGAHLKAARWAGANGGPREAIVWRRQAFEIWKEPQRLSEALTGIAGTLVTGAGGDRPAGAVWLRHAVTMTAELSDIFPERASGVRAILDACGTALGEFDVLGTHGELLSTDEARSMPERVAAANWMATATLAARLQEGRALLVDMGSTTTDIVPLEHGRAAPAGRCDLDRLRTGELLYTGLLRTPPSALTDRVPIDGGSCGVSPEFFTQMADVYLLLGRISADQYSVPTPDRRGTSEGECAARLARLVCSEPSRIGVAGLRTLALHLEDRQIGNVSAAIRRVAGAAAMLPSNAGPPVAIVAGAGWFLAAEAARRAGLQPVRLATLRPDLGTDWDEVAPAAALAVLLAEPAREDRTHGERLE